jgi:hypothetical protein
VIDVEVASAVRYESCGVELSRMRFCGDVTNEPGLYTLASDNSPDMDFGR